MTKLLKNRTSNAWLLLTSAFAVHVFEEAISGFLPSYNDLVLSIRKSLGFFPAPTFSYPVWLGGLIVLLVICFSLTPLVGRAKGYFRIPVAVFSVIMIFNGFIHIFASIYLGRLMPGFWSSFLLIPASIYLILMLYEIK